MASKGVDLGAVEAFADGDVQRVEAGGRGLAVVRRGDVFYVLRDICPHQGARLSDGQVTGQVAECSLEGEAVLERDGEILVCPWHGWQFDLCTGRSLVDGEKNRVRSYPVRIAAGRVLLELD